MSALADFANELGSAAGSVGGAVRAYRDVFDGKEGKDVRDAKAESAWSPKTLAMILGGVLAVAIVLRLAFRRG